MAVLRKILSFIFAILAAVGKLFYMTVILVFRLFLWLYRWFLSSSMVETIFKEQKRL